MRPDDVTSAVVVIVHTSVREIAGSAHAGCGELLRSHLLIDLRTDVRSHAEAFHRVRVKAVHDLWSRKTKAVDVIRFTRRTIDVERHAIIGQRRLIEHAADAKLARVDVVERLRELYSAKTLRRTVGPTVVRPAVIRSLNKVQRGRVRIAFRKVPTLVSNLHAERRAIFAKLTIAQRLDTRRCQWPAISKDRFRRESPAQVERMVHQIATNLIALVGDAVPLVRHQEELCVLNGVAGKNVDFSRD